MHFKHARGLARIEKKRNSVDPFVKVTFFNGKKKIEFKSKSIENTQCPNFDEK